MAGCATIPSQKAKSVGKTQNPESETLRFVVSFPKEVRSEPVTGRVLLFFSKSPDGEPRTQLNWFNPDPVFAVDVEGVSPGDEIAFLEEKFENPDALAFPGPLGRLAPGEYRVQALIDTDDTRRSFNDGPGNLFSEPIKFSMSRGKTDTFHLVADQVIKEEEREENDWVKLVAVRSKLLSDFHNRDVYLRAAVLLPFGYEDEPERTYPAYYEIPGFGGRHYDLLTKSDSDRDDWKDWSTGKNPYRGFEIVIDPDVPLGHSVFANSANNGPVGDALIKELIPAIEERFRIIREPRARFVGGHSSGGWSSLWLQITYPEFFGGCWSTAPDPVDFRAFQTTNIYEDVNGHWTPTGQSRPVGRNRYEPTLTVAKFNHWEYVLGYGGQLDSFDAVFSPRGHDGNPMRMMDKLTGAVNREVAEHWRNYDIRHVLEENWRELGPNLQGKIHIIGGGWDTFYLNPSLDLLKGFLDGKNHGGYVKIVPGDHGSFMTDELIASLYQEMAEQFAIGEPTPAP
jgi:hypothetical protein